MAKKFEKGKMVPVPSHSIVPERDLGKLPVLGLTMPAITNAFLVGWELTQYIGGGFVINAVYVALGELAVVMVLGTMLYLAVKHRGLQKNMVAA